MIPVILSGGSGSRLWPLSRKQFPKQFLALTGEHTLFQQTLSRLVFDGMDAPIVVCNKDHRFIVNEQLSNRKLDCQRILMEPFGRNTAPAVALTAMMLVNEGRDELMLVSDQGTIIRAPVGDVRIASRNTRGVIIFRTAADEHVVSVERVEADGAEDGDASDLTDEDGEEGPAEA